MTGVVKNLIRVWHLKRHLQSLCGHSRFRQRLVLPDGQILLDDAALDGPTDVQLVLVPGRVPSDEQVHELIYAVREGDISRVEQILQRPQNPNLGTVWQTPLMCACACGSVEIVCLLLEGNAEVNRSALLFNETPLHVACETGHVEVV